MDTRKRGRAEGFINGGFKKHKQELDSLTSGIGTKSKPCTKFFSTSGCPFGENCHFSHNVPGGYNAVAHLLAPSPAQPMRNISVSAPPSRAPNGSSAPSIKSKLCSKYNTAEGCKFGEKCHFAHGEWELGKPNASSHEDPRHAGPISNRFGTHSPSPAPSSATFGASATTTITVDASLAGAIIGKNGVNSKQLCFQTGVKLSIREHESDPNVRNIELEGTLEQIREASTLIKDLILRISSSDAAAAAGLPNSRIGGGRGPPRSTSNYKTKLCENFAKGSCTFGAKCHFAHGADEMRKSGV